MYADLSGKTALITGSGKPSGIGYGMAERLAACGANIIIADLGRYAPEVSTVAPATRRGMEDIARDLAGRYSVKTLPVDLDVLNTDSILSMAEEVKEAFPRVDILCNNAGASFGVPNTILSYREEDWIRTVELNLFGVFRVSRAILPLMLSRPGSIINTASRAGKVPPVFNSAYAVAKAGVIMLTKTMAKELAGARIRVNAVCPGQIDTDLQRWRFKLEAEFFNSTIEEREQEMGKTIPLGGLGRIKDVGSLVAFLASEESGYITGQAINIDGGQCMEL